MSDLLQKIAPVKGPVSRLLKLVKLVDGELQDSSGNTITGVASYTKAQTADIGFDTSQRHLLMSDVPVDSYGGKALFLYDPTRTTQKLVQQKPWIHQSTFANLLTNFPAASWPGQMATVDDVPGVVLISNGTRYVPLNGVACLVQKTFGTLTTPSLTATGSGTFNFTSGLGNIAFPVNLFDTGDLLTLRGRVFKAGTGGTVPVDISLGTGGTSADATIYSCTIPNTSGAIANILADIVVGSDTVVSSNLSVAFGGNGAVAAAGDQSTNFNVGAALLLSMSGTQAAADTVAMQYLTLEWRAK